MNGVTRKTSETTKGNRKKSLGLHLIDENFILDKSYMDFVHSDKGVTFKPSQKFLDELNSKKRNISNVNYNLKRDGGAPEYAITNATYYTLKDYANAGWSLAAGDMNNDQSEDLVIGAPVYSFTNAYQTGIAFVILSRNGNLPMTTLKLDDTADYILYSPDPHMNSSKFGQAVEVLDINLDGYNDIIVSAPSYNLENIKYQVFVQALIYLLF